MAFNIDNFNAFQETAGEFTSNLDIELNRLATRIVDEMRANAPVARQNGGALRNSIKLNIDRYNFIIEMLAYGPYQNYGVRGATNDRSGAREDEITGRTHAFGLTNKVMAGGSLPFGARVNIYKYGLRPQPFYNVENITERMAEEIESIIQEI